MGKFIGDLILIHRDKPVDGKWFKTHWEFHYKANDGEMYTVPKGVDTDFASIPRMFRRVISRTGKHDKAAVLHDWLCEYKIVPRKKADKIFMEALKTLKVNVFKRRIMYTGVRSYSIATLKR
jgi:hypothetical protein